jgi:uncharacterized protein (TIGR02594 family)
VTTRPTWLLEAYHHIGMAEVPGPPTHPTITTWLRRLKAWWADDETPWCGVFVAACIDQAGLPLPRLWMRAKAWADWGVRLAQPVPGCIVVFARQGGGHVGFVVGRTKAGLLMVLGGNQGDKVSIAPFELSRVLAYVWPAGVPVPDERDLAMMSALGPVSRNEV